MSTQTDIRDKVIGIVSDAAGKLSNPTDYDRNIIAAVEIYSRHRPDEKLIDLTGNGTHDYAISSLTGWIEGYSQVMRIEYPVGKVPEELMDDDEFGIYTSPSGKRLRLLNDAPPATAHFYVTITIPRLITTIRDTDVIAFSYLAAALCLEELANIYTQTSDPSMAADAVNYHSKGQEYAARAKALRKLYGDHLGVKEDQSVGPALSTADVDVNYPGGTDRLTHPSRERRRRFS